MSLILIKDIQEIEDWKNKTKFFHRFSTMSDIQMAFCKEFELDIFFRDILKRDKREFLEDEAVTKYLNSFDLKYKGNYILKSSNHWGQGLGAPAEQFVTYLDFPLQLACLALYHPEWVVILSFLFYEKKYLIPVLEQRDIYLQYNTLNSAAVLDVKGQGGEIIIGGRSSNEFSYKDYIYYLRDLEEKEQGDKYLTRELDAEVFDESKVFKRDKRLLSEYMATLGEKEQRDFTELCEANPALKETMYIQNGKNVFSELYRRYPLHMLLFINGEWKYHSKLSVKWPTFMEILDEILNPESYYYSDEDPELKILLSSATKIFTLVLNTDEVCDAREYWKYICCFIKYDKEANTIEICNWDEGLLEFHRLLQESTDLLPDA